MISASNTNILAMSIPYICENIRPAKIIGISALKFKELIESYGIDFLDEDKVIDGLTYDSIKRIICKKGGNSKRTGWYFQQFLKYAYSYVASTEYYITWDADTIPLNRVDYFSDGKPSFIIKKEYHKAYFRTLNKLFDGQVFRVDKNISFIAENMVFSKKIVQEIIAYMENNNVQGEKFYEKILFSIDIKDLECGFSEFETYGNYVELKYPNLYQKKQMRTLRDAAIIIGHSPCFDQLNWLKKGYDIVSVENNNVSFSWLTKNKIFRDVVSAKIFVGFILGIRKIKRKVQRKEIISYD